MKYLPVKLCILFCALEAFPGCSRHARTNASPPLVEAFAQADPQEKQAVQMVSSNLDAGNYLEAVRILAPLVRARELTPEQKKAIALTLKQINEGTMDNTNLDSREMYELRSSLFDSAYHK